MGIAFYDASVASYLQVLDAVQGILQKGEEHAGSNGIDLQDLVNFRLKDDMLPFSFQVISVWHHSMGALKGCQEGVFAPPPKMSGLDYAGLSKLITEAQTYLGNLAADEVNALSGGKLVFNIGDRSIPFTTDNFLMSFSLPNFYFHASMVYACLRHQGVPLGKMDYLGSLRVDH